VLPSAEQEPEQLTSVKNIHKTKHFTTTIKNRGHFFHLWLGLVVLFLNIGRQLKKEKKKRILSGRGLATFHPYRK